MIYGIFNSNGTKKKKKIEHMDEIIRELIDRINIMDANMINIYAVYNMHHDNSAHMNRTCLRKYT